MTLWRILFRIPWHILLISAALVVVGAWRSIRRLKGRGNHGRDAMPCGVLLGLVWSC